MNRVRFGKPTGRNGKMNLEEYALNIAKKYLIFEWTFVSEKQEMCIRTFVKPSGADAQLIDITYIPAEELE